LEPENSLPPLPETATCPYPKPVEPGPRLSPPYYLSKIHFIFKNRSFTILLITPVSSKWFLSLWFPHQNSVCTSLLPHMCHIPRPPHSVKFGHPNSIWSKLQKMKLIIMLPSRLPSYPVPLNLKYFS